MALTRLTNKKKEEKKPQITSIRNERSALITDPMHIESIIKC